MYRSTQLTQSRVVHAHCRLAAAAVAVSGVVARDTTVRGVIAASCFADSTTLQNSVRLD
jgi:hypothetical protein